MPDFKRALAENANAVNELLDELLPPGEGPGAVLGEAMRYAALDGGKRVRPFLLMATADMFEVLHARSLRAAAAVEMIHCYSLVHDDLPAMDNDDLRRGKPTCHIKFGEAMAILTGDGLLTKAFEVLADEQTHEDPKVRAELVLALARASGDEGMVGGQVLDIAAETQTLDMPQITRLQRMKTGALIAVAVEMGAILGKASEQARKSLHGYVHDVGLSFQITDDLLDVEGTAGEVGKQTGKDEAAGKATFVSILGVERAREQANLLCHQAIEHLDIFGKKAEPLCALARFIVNRRA